jgi:7-cyano-7-deazaguanine tRNA-ribosyltransferase
LATPIEFPCPCKVCREFTPDEVRTSGEAERYLALHNLYVTIAEMSRIRQSIQEGTLWEQLDERCRSHPRLFDGYHELLTYTKELEKCDRATKKRFFYRGSESCKRTEVMRYHDRLCTIPLPAEVLISLTGKKLPKFNTVSTSNRPLAHTHLSSQRRFRSVKVSYLRGTLRW